MDGARRARIESLGSDMVCMPPYFVDVGLSA